MFQCLIIKIKILTYALIQLGHVIYFLWIPAHCGITNNGKANHLGKLDMLIKVMPFLNISFFDFVMMLKKYIYNMLENY